MMDVIGKTQKQILVESSEEAIEKLREAENKAIENIEAGSSPLNLIFLIERGLSEEPDKEETAKVIRLLEEICISPDIGGGVLDESGNSQEGKKDAIAPKPEYDDGWGEGRSEGDETQSKQENNGRKIESQSRPLGGWRERERKKQEEAERMRSENGKKVGKDRNCIKPVKMNFNDYLHNNQAKK
ncbi:uncharacterized protein L201_006208 [Kwoniella dendrophila CBS 6074]|uniref:Uncharacterized protein n=1 Tax=Kwoniella dendrophila CBS 6074 TaxID=1295534 RepID=A0AAX4K3C3_9TREE